MKRITQSEDASCLDKIKYIASFPSLSKGQDYLHYLAISQQQQQSGPNYMEILLPVESQSDEELWI